MIIEGNSGQLKSSFSPSTHDVNSAATGKQSVIYPVVKGTLSNPSRSCLCTYLVSLLIEPSNFSPSLRRALPSPQGPRLVGVFSLRKVNKLSSAGPRDSGACRHIWTHAMRRGRKVDRVWRTFLCVPNSSLLSFFLLHHYCRFL